VSSDRQRYGMLLVTIVAAFFLQGVGVAGHDWLEVVVTALLSGAVVLALTAARARRPVLRAAVVVAIGVTVLSAVNPDGAATAIANGLVVSVGPPVIAVGLLRGLRSRGVVTIEAVLGVLCIYLLAGMLYAFVYGAIDHLGGAPFFAQGTDATVSRLLYFSFTTLTTIGYGDLTARSNLGHTLVVFDGLVGQVYLVTVVSVIVGNLRRAQNASPHPGDAGRGDTT
jgi:ion channel